MKLTIKHIKKIIQEEIQSLNENMDMATKRRAVKIADILGLGATEVGGGELYKAIDHYFDEGFGKDRDYMSWDHAFELARDLVLHTAPSASLEKAMSIVAAANPNMSLQDVEEEVIMLVAELIEDKSHEFWPAPGV